MTPEDNNNDKIVIAIFQFCYSGAGALAERGLPVPTLYKHYSQASQPQGVTFTAFNVDRDFGDCVDGFVLADLERLTPRKRKRYLAGEGCSDGGSKT